MQKRSAERGLAQFSPADCSPALGQLLATEDEKHQKMKKVTRAENDLRFFKIGLWHLMLV